MMMDPTTQDQNLQNDAVSLMITQVVPPTVRLSSSVELGQSPQHDVTDDETVPSANESTISMSSSAMLQRGGNVNNPATNSVSTTVEHPPPHQNTQNRSTKSASTLGISIPYAPPKWEKLYMETLASHNNLTWSRFPVEEENCADEFQAIVDLVKPFKIHKINKIVNPELWNTYQTQRVTMLKKKSDNVDVLLELGMNETEADIRVRRANNFQKNPLVFSTEEGKYSINEALLFHCSRSFAKVDNLLAEGLDERLGSNLTTQLGKGLYFTDDPIKADQYANKTGIIIIFTVLLGDCKDMGMGRGSESTNMLREPKKTITEMRNPDDTFFESITARLLGSPHNEYVIYNRNQCCPLYEVEYTNNYKNHSRVDYSPECYSTPRRTSPCIAWKQELHTTPPTSSFSTQSYLPNQQQYPTWPFLASMIFNKMGLVDMKISLKRFKDLGFPESSQVTQALINSDYQFNVALNLLRKQRAGRRESDSDENDDQDEEEIYYSPEENEEDDQFDEPFSSQTPPKKKPKITKMKKKKKTPTRTTSTQTYPSQDITGSSTTVLEMECQLCSETITISPNTWITLRCKHSICATCFTKIQKTKTTMSKETHTSTVCPFCNDIDGVIIGDCPDGLMVTSEIQTSCRGYTDYRTIVLIYSINDNVQYEILKQAYLPANQKGKKIAKLLKVAWDRRLIFSIEENPSPESNNNLIWNIHHKTSQTSSGGRGYPDPTYLDRVLEKLASYDIYQ